MSLPSKDNTKSRARQETDKQASPKVVPFPQTFPQNQMDLHWLFLTEHGKDVKWCVEEQAWYIWTGKRWQREEDEHGKAYGWVKRFLISLLPRAATIKDDTARNKAATFAAKCQHEPATLIPALLRLCKNEVAVSLNDFDQDIWLLNVQNGTLDTRTGELREHRRDDMITRIANTAFMPEATCPNWEDFIQWACVGDADFVTWKQRLFGSFLTGSTQNQTVSIDYGDGGNGKSTQYGLLQRLLGSGYVVSMQAASLMTSTKRSGATASPDIMDLKGARLAIASEGEENQHLAAGLTKLLSGGDIIPARPLYGKPVNFKATHKLVLFTNDRPVITDMSGGMWRRVKLMPSLANIDDDARAGRREKKNQVAMDAALDAEMPGILNWLLAGCLAWQQDGLGECDAVDKATNMYRSEMDVIGNFLTEYLAAANDLTAITCKELYSAYALWCEESHQGQVKKPRFEAHLKKHKGCWTDTGTGNVHYWQGLDRLKYGESLPIVKPVMPRPLPIEQVMFATSSTPVVQDVVSTSPMSDEDELPVTTTTTVSVPVQTLTMPPTSTRRISSGIVCPLCHFDHDAPPAVTKHNGKAVFECSTCHSYFDRHEESGTYFAVKPGKRVM